MLPKPPGINPVRMRRKAQVPESFLHLRSRKHPENNLGKLRLAQFAEYLRWQSVRHGITKHPLPNRAVLALLLGHAQAKLRHASVQKWKSRFNPRVYLLPIIERQLIC